MKTIRTEVLDIAYLDDGPQDGEPLLLLHGWPQSPVGFHEVSSRMHESGRGKHAAVSSLRALVSRRRPFERPLVKRTSWRPEFRRNDAHIGSRKATW